jgi:HEAT repeat protein
LDFVDTLNDAFDDIAVSKGYRFRYSFSQQGGEGLVRLGYMEDKKRAAISLVDDNHSEVRYLIVEGESDQTVSEIASALRERLPVIPLAELEETARRNFAQDPKTLIRLAVGSGEREDATAAAIIRQALDHPDRNVRLKAVEAASITQWSSLLPELERKRGEDPDPEVRETAGRALG